MPGQGDAASGKLITFKSNGCWLVVQMMSRYVEVRLKHLGPERQDKYERYGWNHSVEQIVGTGLYRTDIPLNPLSAADHRKIAALLSRLAIAHLANRSFLSLSYGERRLTLLARALASQPKL